MLDYGEVFDLLVEYARDYDDKDSDTGVRVATQADFDNF